MMRKISTDAELKRALKIRDINEIENSEQKISEFVKIMPRIDKDYALMVIDGFSEYQETCLEMAKLLDSNCDRALRSNDKSQKAAIDSYNVILSGLKDKLSKPELSEKERKAITKDMVFVADRIADIDKSNKKFILNVLKYTGLALLFLVFFPLAIIVLLLKVKKDN